MTWVPVGPQDDGPATQDFPCGCGAGPGEVCTYPSMPGNRAVRVPWCRDRGKCQVMVIGPDETTEPCGMPAVGIALIREGQAERMCRWHRDQFEAVSS